MDELSMGGGVNQISFHSIQSNVTAEVNHNERKKIKTNSFSPNRQKEKRLIRSIRKDDKWQNDYHTMCAPISR